MHTRSTKIDRNLVSCACIGISLLVSMASAAAISVKSMKDDDIEHILNQLKTMHRQIAGERQQSRLPVVTVSFAQSLDGKIAPFKESATTETVGNYPLSGEESLRLTHAIRSIHNGILVGGKTLALDNPRLNNRMWLSHSDAVQPTPIVVDTHLNHLSKIKNTLMTQNLIVCCSQQAADSMENLPEQVSLCPCPCGSDGRIDLRQALSLLYQHHGIKSLMVEGGAQVITSIFDNKLVDALCVTITPKLVSHGIGPTFGPRILDLAESSSTFQLGTDLVLLTSIQG